MTTATTTEQHTKEINFAYASSNNAVKLGFAKTGCFFISTGAPEGDYDERKLGFASNSLADCTAEFDKIDLPVGFYSLMVAP